MLVAVCKHPLAKVAGVQTLDSTPWLPRLAHLPPWDEQRAASNGARLVGSAARKRGENRS
eukprot:559450-Prorocentrum_lima.AAC.1